MIYTLNQLEKVCLSQNLIPTSIRLLVSCSGGQDSITLLFLLYQLQPRWNWTLGVTYCNHMWRYTSIESGSKLARIALLLGLSYNLSVAGTKIEQEEEGRTWRVRSLSRIADVNRWKCICTGHTASDRVETLLANLLRGSSSWGIRSISWYSAIHSELWNNSEFLTSIPIVRPALGISRVQMRNYSNRWKLPLCYDPSNQDHRLRRNRIRHELLPYLRHWWNPQIDSLLAQSAEVTSWETVYYDLLCTQICQQYEWIGHGAVRFPWMILQSMPKSLQTRMLWIFLTRASVFLNPSDGFRGDFEFLQLVLEKDRFDYRNEYIHLCKTSKWIKLMICQ